MWELTVASACRGVMSGVTRVLLRTWAGCEWQQLQPISEHTQRVLCIHAHLCFTGPWQVSLPGLPMAVFGYFSPKLFTWPLCWILFRHRGSSSWEPQPQRCQAHRLDQAAFIVQACRFARVRPFAYLELWFSTNFSFLLTMTPLFSKRYIGLGFSLT